MSMVGHVMSFGHPWHGAPYLAHMCLSLGCTWCFRARVAYQQQPVASDRRPSESIQRAFEFRPTCDARLLRCGCMLCLEIVDIISLGVA